MHNQVTVLGTIGADLQRVIDSEHDANIFRWLSLVGIATGNARKVEGRGRSVKTILDLIADGVQHEDSDFVTANGGVVVVAGLT
jgi:hypothetical protein